MPPARILDPRAVPVAGTDSHLPAVAEAALAPDALRARFKAIGGWAPEFPGDGGRFATREPSPAAVLVPLDRKSTRLNSSHG